MKSLLHTKYWFLLDRSRSKIQYPYHNWLLYLSTVIWPSISATMKMHSCVRSWKCIQRERWNIQISVDLTCFHQTIVHFYSWIKDSIDEHRRCGNVAVENEQIAHFLHSLCFHTWAIAVAWILSHGSTILVSVHPHLYPKSVCSPIPIFTTKVHILANTSRI